jgi:hypothetical protein
MFEIFGRPCRNFRSDAVTSVRRTKPHVNTALISPFSMASACRALADSTGQKIVKSLRKGMIAGNFQSSRHLQRLVRT